MTATQVVLVEVFLIKGVGDSVIILNSMTDKVIDE